MNKVLLIRFSSIGDIVLTTPVIRSLKKQTSCQLHVLTKARYAGILLSNPYVDKTHLYNDNLPEITDQLKLEQYDFVVDLQKNLRSYKIRKSLKIPSSTFPKVNIQKWLLVHFKLNHLPEAHVVDRYFEAVGKLNVVNDRQGLDYFIPLEDEVDLRSVNPVLTKGFIGFVIGGRHNTKILPVAKIIPLVNELPLPVVLLGGRVDKERGKQIVEAASRKHVFNGCGEFNLNQSASLVKQSRLIITNDTGLMHIAAAFRKPVISIWGNTVPDFGMYPYLPDGDSGSYIAQVQGLKCRPCSKLGYKKCPKNHFKCMLDQDESRILQKARELLKG